MNKSTKFNFVLILVLFLVLTFTLSAQLQNANWYFGKSAGINFNDGSQPVSELTNGVMSTTGATASLSDASGNLLFYTDGIRVWDKNHNPMKGGSGLLYGSENVSQGVILVPNPAIASQYYIFTNQGFDTGSHGLSYSIIDMTEQSGLGMVLEKSLNTPLLQNSSEKLTSVYNQEDNSYWVISFGQGIDSKYSDTFYTFKIDENGINLHCQSTHPFLPENIEHSGGQMKISPDGSTLAMVHNTIDANDGSSLGIENIFSFDFKMATGEVYSKTVYSLNDVLYCYGLEFSPDSDKFLVSSTHRISDGASESFVHQIWYRNADPLYTIEQIICFSEEPIYSLQLGIDGNVYGTSFESFGIHCFGNPNGLSQEVCFDPNKIDLNGRYATRELPQLVPDQLVPYDPIGQRTTDTKYTILENPFEEDLRIKFHVTGQFDIVLQNMSGSKVFTTEITIETVDRTKSFDVEDLNDGMYILTITDQDHNNEEWSATVIKVDD